ncbi:MAG: hypothetical protein Q4D44_05950 [Eubacteriales bacterium]|nr:hypothetical protein [Eubacteriales bacterium]
MSKKILCLALTLTVMMCMAVTNVSAANSETDSKIYLSIPDELTEVGFVECSIREYKSVAPLVPCESDYTRCLKEKTGLYSYDTARVGGIEKGTYYSLTVSASDGAQSQEMLLSQECLGDTLVCTVSEDNSSVDANSCVLDCTWKNQSADEYGVLKTVNDSGEVTGDCLPLDVTPYDFFEDFMVNGYEQTKESSQKSDQELIDDIAIALNVNSDSIDECLKENEIETEWTKDASKAMTAEESASADSKDSVSTGQERTIVYISVAMMFISAGVIFFARKNRLATVVA